MVFTHAVLFLNLHFSPSSPRNLGNWRYSNSRDNTCTHVHAPTRSDLGVLLRSFPMHGSCLPGFDVFGTLLCMFSYLFTVLRTLPSTGTETLFLSFFSLCEYPIVLVLRVQCREYLRPTTPSCDSTFSIPWTWAGLCHVTWCHTFTCVRHQWKVYWDPQSWGFSLWLIGSHLLPTETLRHQKLWRQDRRKQMERKELWMTTMRLQPLMMIRPPPESHRKKGKPSTNRLGCHTSLKFNLRLVYSPLFLLF